MKTWQEITTSRPDTAERRAAYEQGRQEAVAEIVAYNLSELRKLRSITQVELARHLGVAQPTLSGLERRSDVQLSTLRDYIEGLGGHLEVSAIFDDIRVPVDLLLREEEGDEELDDERGASALARSAEDAGPGTPSARKPYPGQSLSARPSRKEEDDMATSRHTGRAAASAASKVLRDKRTSATSKRAAGSALSQAAPKPRSSRRSSR